MYRGEGVFKQIGDSDYKARVNIMYLAIANGTPTYIEGRVSTDDQITPVKFASVTLRLKDQQGIVTKTTTDNAGRFVMSGVLSNDNYQIEIDAPEYVASKTILVEPNKPNCHEIFATKK